MSSYQHIPTHVNLPLSTYLPVPIPKYQYIIAADPGAGIGLVLKEPPDCCFRCATTSSPVSQLSSLTLGPNISQKFLHFTKVCFNKNKNANRVIFNLKR